MEFLRVHHVSTDSDSSSLGARAIAAVQADSHLVLSEIRRHWHAGAVAGTDDLQSSPLRVRRLRPHKVDAPLPTRSPRDSDGGQVLQSAFPRVELPPSPDLRTPIRIPAVCPENLAEEFALLREIGKAKAVAAMAMMSWIFGQPENLPCLLLDDLPDNSSFCFQVSVLGWKKFAVFPNLPRLLTDFPFVRAALANVPTLPPAPENFGDFFVDESRAQGKEEVRRRIALIESELHVYPGVESEFGLVLIHGKVAALQPSVEINKPWWPLVNNKLADLVSATVEEIKITVAVARSLGEPWAAKLGHLSRALLLEYMYCGQASFLKQAVSTAWVARQAIDLLEPFTQPFNEQFLVRPQLVSVIAWVEARMLMENCADADIVRDPQGLAETMAHSFQEVKEDRLQHLALRASVLRTAIILGASAIDAYAVIDDARSLNLDVSCDESPAEALEKIVSLILRFQIQTSL